MYREDFDTIMDITKCKTKAGWGADPMQGVETKVKSAFTRSFNKAGLPVRCTIMVEDGKKSKGKKAAPAPVDTGDDAIGGEIAEVRSLTEGRCIRSMQLLFAHMYTRGRCREISASTMMSPSLATMKFYTPAVAWNTTSCHSEQHRHGWLLKLRPACRMRDTQGMYYVHDATMAVQAAAVNAKDDDGEAATEEDIKNMKGVSFVAKAPAGKGKGGKAAASKATTSKGAGRGGAGRGGKAGRGRGK